MAHAAKKNVADAGAEQAKFEAAAAKVGDEVFGNNQVSLLTQIARHVLASKVAAARGDEGQAVQHLQQAVAAQDELWYDEPPPWPWSVRETLGAMLLQQGDASDAETVFRKDLEIHMNNPRSLFGLAASLRAQGKDQEAQQVQSRADRALQDADVKIRIEDF
jgi:Flp pilus assembly protein TadD